MVINSFTKAWHRQYWGLQKEKAEAVILHCRSSPYLLTLTVWVMKTTWRAKYWLICLSICRQSLLQKIWLTQLIKHHILLASTCFSSDFQLLFKQTKKILFWLSRYCPFPSYKLLHVDYIVIKLGILKCESSLNGR